MRIAMVAEASGLMAHTIRFYEKSGILPEIERGAVGHRRFTYRHVEWITLLYWLRKTGMPVKQMRQFRVYAKAGDVAIAERRQILANQANTLNAKRTTLKKSESVFAVKIASYSPVLDEDNSCSLPIWLNHLSIT